jgi:hypothetical protein
VSAVGRAALRQVALVLAALLAVVGSLWIKKIVEIEV